MSELEDLIEENVGVKLHRKRVLMAFGDVHEGPLLDVLFKQTRPPLRKPKPVAGIHKAKPKPPPPTIVRKGMVDYRRGR